MSEIKELTEIEKAADRYAHSNYMHPTSKCAEISFIKGAEWQKERDNKIAFELVGLHDFIADPIQRAKFIEIVNKLL